MRQRESPTRSTQRQSDQPSRLLGGLQSRIIKIQPVKHLIVVISRSRLRMVSELRCVCALEEENGRIRRRELGMKPGIVEGVVLVAEDLHRLSPRSSRR